MSRARAVLAGVVMSFGCADAVAAQQTHVLIITGLGGEPQYSETFHAAGSALYQAAKSKWGVAAGSVIYLAEDPARDPAIAAKSTREEVAKAFAQLAARAAPGDVVLVFLLGHGSGEGVDSRVNLPGPDPTAADYKMWLSVFARQNVVFVNASSASGDFVQQLAAPGRVVVTATKSALERNESVFATYFARGLTTGEADADKDGRVSVLEAFDYARKEVARQYEGANKLQTEHAVLSDSILAQTVAFGGAAGEPRSEGRRARGGTPHTRGFARRTARAKGADGFHGIRRGTRAHPHRHRGEDAGHPRSGRTPVRRMLLLALASTLSVTPPQVLRERRTVQALEDEGKLDEAERSARAAGNRLGATLGEVLVLRGRLKEADSVFRAAIAASSVERRIAEVSLAELAARHGDFE